MTATNHMLTGAIIGTLVPNPVAIPLALASHFVLDSLPHFGAKDQTNLSFKLIILTDGVLCAILLATLLMQQPANLLWTVLAAVAAASPDIMWLPHWLRKLRREPPQQFNAVERFHKNIQWGERWYFAPIEFFWAFAAIATLVKLT